jgi:hypothetical protein
MSIRAAFIVSVIFVFFVAACSREDTEKVEVVEVTPATEVEESGQELPAGHPMISRPVEELPTSLHPSATSTKEVRVSDEIKAMWKEVKLEVLDSSSETSEVLTMEVGRAVPLKDSGFKLKVEVFVPDYAMFPDHIGSRSNEPRNAAVLVELFEGEKSVAKGWVFKAFPDFNSYGHERFSLALLEPVSGNN